MASRRMFSLQILDSDMFLDMPLSTQALYVHLCMRADDDGFVNNPKKIMRMIGASDDDVKVLIAKRFIMTFESGIIVISDWKIHNVIRKDRYSETRYIEEKSLLIVKENGAYTELDDKWLTNGCQMGVKWVSQDRIGKDRIGKDRREIGEVNSSSANQSEEKNEKNYLNSLRFIFGIKDRSFTGKEEEYITKWHDEMNMSEEMITLAYEYCILRINKLSFPYIDKIISEWSSKNIHSIEAAENENMEFKKQKADLNAVQFNNDDLEKFTWINTDNE